MQFLPENKKRTIVYLVSLALAVGGSAYLLLKNPSAPPPPPSVSTGGTRSALLLPYGSQIDTALIQGDKFRALVAPPPLTVQPEEQGKTDLFQ